MKSYRDLQVWQRGIELAKATYQAAASLPAQEIYGLRSQMCRAAVSIPSNIAEGQKRGTRKDFAQFLRIAYGSSAELETQIEIARHVYPSVDFTKTSALLEETQKMLPSLIKKISSADN